YGESSAPSDLYRKFGLDVDSVVERIEKAVKSKQ
ncbi:MAG: transketolase family protein, partial [Caldiserica bacterium]|nr:transketolase family protein [Caldisericota bacterium]